MEQYLPLRETSPWLDCTNQDQTRVGCDICGWEKEETYEIARQMWLDHMHDPIEDIKWRVMKYKNTIDNMPGYIYAQDVEFLIKGMAGDK